jgi:RNA polymerase sigma factor (sigma-70 family)
MQEPSDMELLRQYAEQDSELAFAALVTRHINLVYSAALRKTGNLHAAEEITQAVFIILAKKAPALRRETILPGWLYQTARLTAANFLRNEIRRVRREQELYMQSISNETEAWPQIEPLLDDAMGRLNEKERNAVVLRFFEGRSFQEIGAAFGGSENAAKKRVVRGLEKLKKYFAKRGLSSTAVFIGAAISAHSVQAAPVALAKSVTAVAIVKGAAASGSTLTLIKGALKLMAWTKAKTAIGTAVCVLLAAGATIATIHWLTKSPQTVKLVEPVVRAGAVPPDWFVANGNPNQWSWADGKFYGSSDQGDSMLITKQQFGDVAVSAIVGTTNRQVALTLRMEGGKNGYFAIFIPDQTVWSAANRGGKVILGKRINWNQKTLKTYRGPLVKAAGYSAKLTFLAKGPHLEIRFNDESILQTDDPDFTSGSVGLRVYGESGKPCDATFLDVTYH